MTRMIVCAAFVSLIGMVAPPVPAQTTAPAPSNASGDKEWLERLRPCREGLLDPDARAVERQRWAELLFTYDSPEARALRVELLSLQDRPNVQRTLCTVIRDRARQAPERLDAALIKPLLDLLGADAADLRDLAARALADFPGPDVPKMLGALASDAQAPLTKRLAAIDALAPNTHRRDVVGQLIHLLDADVPQITQRVVASLEPISSRSLGSDVQQWRSWWAAKSKLSQEAWLAEQLQIHRDRLRRVVDELQHFREETRRREAIVSTRIQSFQRELYRALNDEQRDLRLATWLRDELPDIKRTALAIIKARVADEGKRPTGTVLEALLALLQDPSSQIRREVLEIVQNLNDPSVATAVLAQLDQEKDATTRHAVFKALGKLDDPKALPALVREIAAPDSSSDCVREAALALGRVAGQASATLPLPDVVKALRDRYQGLKVDQTPLRAALLSAMAGVGDPSFAPEFLSAVESDDPSVLREAIRGLRAISDMSKLPRLRTLMAHADPLVRLQAVEAVGQLGHEEADLERLLSRLDPTAEPNERAREAAWHGFCTFLDRRPVSERIEAAKRLRETPALEIRYLKELDGALSTSNGNVADREVVLDRLATVLEGEKQYPEAATSLRSLYDLQCSNAHDTALPDAGRLLAALLRGGSAKQVSDLIRQLDGKAEGGTEQNIIIETIAKYVDTPDATIERIQALLAELRTIPPESMGEAWTELLGRMADRVRTESKEPTASSPAPAP